MSTNEDDLDLLLSLRDRVLETPPGSPSSLHPRLPGYTSDDGSPKRSQNPADMSAFRESVKDYLSSEPSGTGGAGSASLSKNPRRPGDIEAEKFSGLRIRNILMSEEERSNHFSDVRFVRLPAVGNSMAGNTIAGCWATVGVLTEKGIPKLSSNGKNYCICKLGCLDESNVSLFLFGDAYTKNLKEPVGAVFALFNAGVRKDAGGKGFSISIYSAGQILKMGTSVDFGVCKGKRKDGIACTMVIDKRKGIYCKYHTMNASQKYFTMRSELKGGNLRTAFRTLSEGVYGVDPSCGRTNSTKSVQPLKVLSVDGLKRALSTARKVTTKSQSQGIRFLTEVAAEMEPKDPNKGSARPNQFKGISERRLPSAVKMASDTNQGREAKRKKTIIPSEKIIELAYATSDEEG